MQISLFQGDELKQFCIREKRRKEEEQKPYLITDTGGHPENGKMSERTISKELGNQAGRNFGRCPTFLVLA